MLTKSSQSLAIYAVMFTVFIVKTFAQQQLLQEQTKKHILQSPIEYKYLLFTAKCFDTFFTHGDWFNFDCLKLTFTKCLGYGLIMGGAIIKFPQIIKIIARKSVTGISFISVVLQLTTNILMTGYCIYKQNPFSLYGENVFIGIQMLFIIGLFIAFGEGNKSVYTAFFISMIALGWFATDPSHLPVFLIENSIVLQTVLICASRMTQIYKVFEIKSTGSLALPTWALSLVGNFARIATILVQASNDLKFLFSMFAVAFLNATIVFQFWLYRNQKVKKQ